MHRLLLPLSLVLASQALAFVELMPVPQVSTTEARVLAATSNVERELAQIDVLVEASAWDEAVDALLRLADESSTELLAVTDDQYVPVSTAAGMRIARWPAAGMAVYRQRVDAAARSLYERGIRERNRKPLLAVVDDYFASSVGDDALLALADMALEAGQTNLARGYLLQLSARTLTPDGRPWGLALGGADLNDAKVRQAVQKQVAAPTTSQASILVYPDTDIPAADILARLAMVSIREQSFDRAQRELAVLEIAFPNAEATIGGRQAKLVDAVAGTLASAREWPAPTPLSAWTTYGGDATRGGTAGPLGDLSQTTWRRRLVQTPIQVGPQPQIFLDLNGRLVQPTASRPQPQFVYPLVSGPAVAIEQEGKWLALDPATGKLLYGKANDPLAMRRNGDRVVRVENRDNPIRRPMGEARAQIRIQVGGNAPVVIKRRGIEGRAVLGANELAALQEIGIRRGVRTWSESSPTPLAAMSGSMLYHAKSDGPQRQRLEAIDLDAEGKLRLEIGLGESNQLSGPPVVTDQHLYLPLREAAAGGRIEIACYARNTGRQLWQAAVASVAADASTAADLLVMGEGMLYLSTEGGVIVAVRASDGRVMWARTYERKNSTKPNDLTQVASRSHGAAMLAEGALVCAPADSPTMFALDPVSGRTLWTNDQAWDVDHLLGAASGRLIATGRQLWMIDPVTGETQFVWPDNKAVDITSSGRGCIAGDEIFWPTERAIYVFDSRTGQQSRNPIALDKLGGVGGANLVPCGDGLLVATKSELILLGDKPPAEEKPEPKPTTLSQR
ncbi:PQQ-binding-like beta-propeller repeat protein [Aeoliella sp.]|uniref:outer membrane protein assembly factor BamB family protein n=1 Tax=Aeoliella sp. TaxID=2795800 RepID=UPI003CCC0B94